MAVRWAVTGGTWSSTSTWNDGATLGIPTVDDDVWTNGFTVNMDVNATVNSLNNTARARTIATPAMTSSSTPSGNVTSSAANVFSAVLAFDRSFSQGSRWSTTFVNPSWIQYQFPTSKIIKAYKIFGYSSGGAESPLSWTLQGSNDGVNFTILDTQTNVSILTGSWTSNELANNTLYSYYRLNITANSGGVNLSIQEIEYYEPFTALIAVGGSFNFNTAGVTVNISNSIGLNTGTNSPIFTVTAASGLVTISSPTVSWTAGNLITIYLTNTGNCNLTITAVQFSGFRSDSAGANSGRCIEKSGTGLLTLNGSVLGQGGFRNSGNHGIIVSNGSVTVNGSVVGGFSTSTGGANYGINMTGGNVLTVNGDVVGGVGHTSNAIVHRGSNLIVSGNVSNLSTTPPGAITNAIDTTAPMTITGNISGGVGGYTSVVTNNTLNVIGNIIGGVGACISTTSTLNITGVITAGSVAAITTSSAISINITGDVYSSSVANAINASSATVNLTGNMYNTLGRMAIWCPNVFISNTATTLWRMDIGGGLTRTLYSLDTFPNLPSTTNVRQGVGFGPSSGLTGTMVVPSVSNVRTSVPVDNTVGIADITATDILNFINTSSDPLAVRMRTMLTDNSAGQIISEYNFV
jgi:hypothetical protein